MVENKNIEATNSFMESFKSCVETMQTDLRLALAEQQEMVLAVSSQYGKYMKISFICWCTLYC